MCTRADTLVMTTSITLVTVSKYIDQSAEKDPESIHENNLKVTTLGFPILEMKI